MKIGIVLPSWMYNDERTRLATAAFASLSRTSAIDPHPALLILAKFGSGWLYDKFAEALPQFDCVLKEDRDLSGTEQTLAWGTQELFNNPAIDYVTWMGDDALFHPDWLLKLQELIVRHPDAKSWSVYRSNHEYFHKTLSVEGDDVLVRSICGHGLTLGRTEWAEWGINWRDGHWFCHSGDTLDLVHAEHRPGQRWVTRKSYVEHTGWRNGVHCTGGEKEYAQEFQGQ